MSVQTVARKFVDLCRQGKNFDVMKTMYDPNIVSVEGDGKETAGQGPVIKKSEDWVSDKTFNGETVAGPFYNGANPDQFVVFFTLDITPKATGKRITLEEVGVYTVKNDLITREQFFYDGALRTVRKLTLTFSQAVTLGSGAVTLALKNTLNCGSGSNDDAADTDVSAALGTPTTADGGVTWVFTFVASGFTETKSLSLKDGIYASTVHASLVNPTGTHLAGDVTSTFHRLFGDTDGNKSVNTIEYNRFKVTYGLASTDTGYNPLFDFDLGGSVNTIDYNNFKSRFGITFTY